MKTKYAIFGLLFFIFWSFSSFAQSKKIISWVLDTQNKPLADVHILTNNQKTSITNSEGKLELIVQNEDSIFISHIGYETQFFLAKDFPKKIVLKEQAMLLSQLEFVAKKRKTFRKNIGTFWNKKKRFYVSGKAEYVLWIDNEYETEGFLKEAYFRVSRHVFGSKKLEVKAQINFYDSQKNALTSPIITTFSSRSKTVKVDIEKYAIAFPKKGIFVSMQIVGFFDKDKWIPIENSEHKFWFTCTFDEEQSHSFHKIKESFTAMRNHEHNTVNLMFGLSIIFLKD